MFYDHFSARSLLAKLGVLVKNVHTDENEMRVIVLPKSCIDIVLHELHDNIGHPGRDRTLSLIKGRFYWPGYTRDVDNYVKHCFRWLCRKSRTVKSPVTPILTSHPLELVCIDYLLVEPSQKYLLVITDHFTKFAKVIPTKNESAKTTAKVLMEQFINLYGYPQRIHSDQGRHFDSALIKQLCELSGIAKSRTTPYHPEGNGACERFNSTLLVLLGTLASDKKSRWKEYLNTLVFAYNCTPHQSTDYTPYQLLFGRTPRLPVDFKFGIHKSEESSNSYDEFVSNLKQRMEYTQSLVCDNMKQKAKKF